MRGMWRRLTGPISAAWNAGEAAASPLAAGPLGALLTRRIIQDGELILLVLKPSIWFIPISMLKFAAVVFILMIAAILMDEQLPGHSRMYVEICIFVLAGRFMWSVLQWMSRLYILTDMRIVTLWGVFTHDISDCPLRKVARTRILRSTRERILGLGSIEIIPLDEAVPIGLWQTVSRPVAVNEQIAAAISKARQGMM